MLSHPFGIQFKENFVQDLRDKNPLLEEHLKKDKKLNALLHEIEKIREHCSSLSDSKKILDVLIEASNSAMALEEDGMIYLFLAQAKGKTPKFFFLILC